METTKTGRSAGRRWLTTGVAALVAALAVITPASTSTAEAARPHGLTGMKILLTNDDSMQAALANPTDGLGLYAIRKELCAEGADVVVIAPWAVQSGKGSAVTNSGSFTLARRTALPAGYETDCTSAPAKGAVYGVCTGTTPCGPASGSATPADTVMFATRGGLKATVGWDKPDLVVSGSNSGVNVSNSVNDSGTAGAAIMANSDGFPAVAFSSSTDASFFLMPVVNYTATAKWGAAFLADLNNKGLLLQNTFALNINYPDVSTVGSKALRAQWTKVGAATVGYHNYTMQSDGSFKVAVGLCSGVSICTETRRTADWTAVSKSHISVTPISWDRTYAVPEGGRTYQKVKAFVERYTKTS